MDADFIMTAISTVGFPIGMSIYLVTRMETTIKDLTVAVNALVASQKVKADV